jgi:DNA topoisomerase-1
MKLVIVESPAKCKKIQGYLGDGYAVVATMGHIRALEESIDSVGIDREWVPKYAEIKTKKEAIQKLKAAAKGKDIILATDDDREGEGIAWHVCFLLKLNPATTPRIVFHEITQTAIQQAAAHPRTLDLNKVNAQQARAMLDLLVGFTVSKVLWSQVAPKLSAGRCQTPALRLVVERDQEIDQHRANSFWRLSGTFQAIQAFAEKDIATAEEATNVLKQVCKNTKATILTAKETVSTSQPPKPLITSSLQQEASTQFGLNPKTTMQAAQKLYEQGLITYMRTDNPLLASEAASQVRAHIQAAYGTEFVGSPGQHTIQEVTTKKETTVQAAHEAIRPTHPETKDPNLSDPVQKKIYNLIWTRTMQSQMSPSKTDLRKVSLELEGDKGRIWWIEQSKINFPGYRIFSPSSSQEADCEAWKLWKPILVPGAVIHWTTLKADEMFTKPKGRYTEASLIAELEKRGIGRPSTFATLVSTIVDREYVEKTNVEGRLQESQHFLMQPNIWPPHEKKESKTLGQEKNKMRATPLGLQIAKYLVKEYGDLFAYSFTAQMEQSLDEIATGGKPWKSLLQETWDTYKDRYASHTSVKAARERLLADGIKVILSKKGPLYVKEPLTGKKATFASLQSGVTFETATAQTAAEAFAKEAGDLIGMWESQEIRKKKGPYGFYVESDGIKVPIKGEEVLEEIIEKLVAKKTFATTEQAFSRQLGDFTIKKGPYGLYFFKHTLKRVTFVSFPKDLDPNTIILSDLQVLYSNGLKKKKFKN